MRFRITTLGCKVNAYESEFYVEQLKKAGYIEAGEDEPCDVSIINTCTVTNMAAQKSRKKIHQEKRLNPNAKIVVVGCYVQHASKEAREDLDADLIIGAKYKGALVEKINELMEKDQKTDLVENVDSFTDFEEMPITCFETKHRAFLKVEDGCNQFCSYCAIPFARGRERSLPHDQVISIAKALEQKGHKEIVLTGIHTGRYYDHGMHLADLLKLLLEHTSKDVYYRISSIEITEVSDELLELMKEDARICHHLHIPVQSASNETLKRMNRPYTIEQFKERVEKIRMEIPDISISTDVITGFVQESDEEFAQTVKNIQDIGFSFLHVFPYSKRDGTAASKLKGEVHGSIQKERTNTLLKLSNELRLKDMKRFNSSLVLIETENKDYYTGYTLQYHPVRITKTKPLEGRILVENLQVHPDGYYVA